MVGSCWMARYQTRGMRVCNGDSAAPGIAQRLAVESSRAAGVADAGSGADRPAEFQRLLGREKLLDEQQTEIQCGAGAARSEKMIIHHDTVVGQKIRQLVRDGKMRG